MEILWWLAPAGGVTVLAMVWAAWAGRPQADTPRERSEADYEKFAAAIAKEHPATGYARLPKVHDRSTGIAVRPSRREA